MAQAQPQQGIMESLQAAMQAQAEQEQMLIAASTKAAFEEAERAKRQVSDKRRAEEAAAQAMAAEDAALMAQRAAFDSSFAGQLDAIASTALANYDLPGKHALVSQLFNSQWSPFSPNMSLFNPTKCDILLQRRVLDAVCLPTQKWNLVQPKPGDSGYAVNLQIVQASNLSIGDTWWRSSDPYCIVHPPGKPTTLRTSVKKRTLSPVWRERFDFNITTLTDPIRIDIYDYDLLGSDDYLGCISVPLSDFAIGKAATEKWYDVVKGSGKVQVAVCIQDAQDVKNLHQDLTSVDAYQFTGVMTKRATNGTNRWASRFFLLQEDTLKWWESAKQYEKGKPSKNAVTIDENSIVRDASIKPLCLEIWSPRGTSFYMYAETDQAKQEWRSAISRTITRLKLPDQVDDCLLMVLNMFQKSDNVAIPRVVALARKLALEAGRITGSADATTSMRTLWSTFAFDPKVTAAGTLTNAQCACLVLASMGVLAHQYLATIGGRFSAIVSAPFIIHLTSLSFSRLLDVLAVCSRPLLSGVAGSPPFSGAAKCPSIHVVQVCARAALLLLQAHARSAVELRVDAAEMAAKLNTSTGRTLGTDSTLFGCTRRLLMTLLLGLPASSANLQTVIADVLVEGFNLWLPTAASQAELVKHAICVVATSSDSNAAEVRGYERLLLRLQQRMSVSQAISHIVLPADDTSNDLGWYHDKNAQRVFRALRLSRLLRRVDAKRIGGLRLAHPADTLESKSGDSALESKVSTSSSGRRHISLIFEHSEQAVGTENSRPTEKDPAAIARNAAARKIQQLFVRKLAIKRAEKEDIDPFSLVQDPAFVKRLVQLVQESEPGTDAGNDSPAQGPFTFGQGAVANTLSAKPVADADSWRIRDSQVIGFLRWAASGGKTLPTSLMHLLTTAAQAANLPTFEVRFLTADMLESKDATSGQAGGAAAGVPDAESLVELSGIHLSEAAPSALLDVLIGELWHARVGKLCVPILLTSVVDLIARAQLCIDNSTEDSFVCEHIVSITSRLLTSLADIISHATSYEQSETALGVLNAVLIPLLAALPAFADHTNIVLTLCPLLDRVWIAVKANPVMAGVLSSVPPSTSDFASQLCAWYSRLLPGILVQSSTHRASNLESPDWQAAIALLFGSEEPAKAWRRDGMVMIRGAIGGVLALFGGRLVAGGAALSTTELKLQRWLTSRLMCGGFLGATFDTISAASDAATLTELFVSVGTANEYMDIDPHLQLCKDLMANKDDGKLINAFMENLHLCPDMLVRRSGGKRLVVVCRSVTAAAVWHGGFAPLAAQAAALLKASAPEEEVRALIGAGTPLHALWCAAHTETRRFIEARHAALQANRSNEGVVASDQSASSDLYRLIKKDVDDRVELLLRLRALEEDVNLARGRARRHMVQTMAAPSAAGLTRQTSVDGGAGGKGWRLLRKMYRDGSLETLKWRINTFARAATDAGIAAPGTLIGEVLQFACSDILAARMEAVLRHAGRRALCRVYGLKLFQSLLSAFAPTVSVTGTTVRVSVDSATASDSTLYGLVSTLIRHLRCLPKLRSAMFYHYLDHIQAGGVEAVAAASGAIRALQLTMMSILNGPMSNPRSIVALLDAFRFQYIPSEEQHLKRLQVLTLCAELMRGRKPTAWLCDVTPEIAQAAALLFASLSMLVFRLTARTSKEAQSTDTVDATDDAASDETKSEDASPMSPVVSAGGLLNPLQAQVLDISFRVLRDAGLNDVVTCRILLGVLAAISDAVSEARSSNADHPATAVCNAVANLLVTPRWFNLLLKQCFTGEATLRQMAIRIVGRHVHVVEPAIIECSPSLPERLMLESAALQYDDYNNLVPAERLLIANELLELARVLLLSEKWRADMIAALAVSLADIPDLWARRSPDSVAVSQIPGTLAALDVLCTPEAVLCVGSRVRITSASGSDLGHVVALGPDAAQGLRRDEALVVSEFTSPHTRTVMAKRQLTCLGPLGLRPPFSSLPIADWVAPLIDTVIASSSSSFSNATGGLPWLMLQNRAVTLLEQCMQVMGPAAVSWVVSAGKLATFCRLAAQPSCVSISGDRASLAKLTQDALCALLERNGSTLGLLVPADISDISADEQKEKWTRMFVCDMSLINKMDSKPLLPLEDSNDFLECEPGEVEGTSNISDGFDNHLMETALGARMFSRTVPTANRALLQSVSASFGTPSEYRELVRHACGLEYYRSMQSIRQIMLKLLSLRLREEGCTVTEFGEARDILAVIKFAAALNDANTSVNASELPVVWDIVLRLLHRGDEQILEMFIHEAFYCMATAMNHSFVVESPHPIPPLGGMCEPAVIDIASNSTLVEFDRRTQLSNGSFTSFSIALSSSAPTGPTGAGEAMTVTRVLEPSRGGPDLSPAVFGPRISFKWDFGPSPEALMGEQPSPIWGFKMRLRPLQFTGFNDFGVLYQPLDWPLLRLLTGTSTMCRALMQSPDGARFFRMLLRYLQEPNVPHKWFVCRCLCRLLAEHRTLPGSPLRADDDPVPAGQNEDVRAPYWPMTDILFLYKTLIQRVHAFKLEWGFHTVCPYFRALFNVVLLAKPLILRSQHFQNDLPTNGIWYRRMCVCAQVADSVYRGLALPQPVVETSLEEVRNDMELLRACVFMAEECVIGRYQNWSFPRGSWLQAAREASNVQEMQTVIRTYESPLIGPVFDWDRDGYQAWCTRECTTIPQLAMQLIEIQEHIKEAAMVGAWQGRKRNFFATLRGIANSETPQGREFEQVADVTSIMRPWSLTQMEQLTEYVAKNADEGARNLAQLTLRDIGNNDRGALALFPAIRDEPLPVIRGKFAVLKHFNAAGVDFLGIVDSTPEWMKEDFDVPGLNTGARMPVTSWDVGSLTVRVKRIFFLTTKTVALAMNMQGRLNTVSPQQGGIQEVVINRVKANDAQDHLRAGNDSTGKAETTSGRASMSQADATKYALQSFWGQLFSQLVGANVGKLIRPDQAFKVRFAGEGGHDVGGLYRDLVTNACEEIQSTMLGLLLKAESGEQEVWFPAPNASSNDELQQFELLGVLMGIMATNTSTSLSLDLPALFWKRMVDDPLTWADVASVNDAIAQKIRYLSTECKDMSQADLDSVLMGATFVESDLSGTETELVPDGRRRRVTPENVQEYATRLQQFWLNTSSRQLNCMHNGICRIVSARLLPLLTWHEAQRLVTGVADIDVNVLKRKTYLGHGGFTETDPVIQMLWSVLEEDFTSDDRKQFLKFVWGRTRLPATEADWGAHSFKLTPHAASENMTGDAVNEFLPVSHTCFFQLELPRYTLREKLKEKLLYAQRACAGIDADDTMEGRANAAMGGEE